MFLTLYLCVALWSVLVSIAKGSPHSPRAAA